MSWMPSNDPILGDPQTCDALELVIVPRTRDLGDGFAVRRALPHGKRQMVGPFIFFDHFGPVQFVSGQGMDVRPHPHIGLATVTYLFDGSIMHRDSEGNVQEIQPGAMNLMTAGRGIAHSERTPAEARVEGAPLHGIQTWVALPLADEEAEPAFHHFGPETLPRIEQPGVNLTVVAGHAQGLRAPVPVFSPTLYLAGDLRKGARFELDDEHEERALYVVDGAVEIDGAPIDAHTLAMLPMTGLASMVERLRAEAGLALVAAAWAHCSDSLHLQRVGCRQHSPPASQRTPQERRHHRHPPLQRAGQRGQH